MFYVKEKLGETRYRTHDGYLLCVDVPISRVGVFEYNRAEVGIEGGSMVRIERTEEELFKPEAIASFEGKPFVISHEDFVTPENYRQVSRGTVQNVRRGEGEKSDLLLADILVCDKEAIEKIESGELKELSIGYEANVVQDDYGKGHQEGFVGNHVALVPAARCGRVCAIGDAMKLSWKNLVRRAFKDGDEEALNDALDTVEERKEPVLVEQKPAEQADEEAKPEEQADEGEGEKPSLEARLASLEEAVKALLDAKKADKEEAKAEEKTADEEAEKQADEAEEEKPEQVADSEAEQVLADAEELAGEPVKRPTCDGVNGGYLVDTMRRVKLNALKTADSRYTAHLAVDTLEGNAIDVAFGGALALRRQLNNPLPGAKRNADSVSVDPSRAFNERMADFWKARRASNN